MLADMRWIVFWLVILAFILVPFFLFEQNFNALGDRIASGAFPRSIEPRQYRERRNTRSRGRVHCRMDRDDDW